MSDSAVAALFPGLIPSSIFDAAPSPEVARGIWDCAEKLPVPFRRRLLENFESERNRGVAIGNLHKAVRELGAENLPLTATDAEICDYAAERANEARSLMMSLTGAIDAAGLFSILAGYCKEFGALVPEKATLIGLCAMVSDAQWWRRQVRRNHGRKVEEHAIKLGMVHRYDGLYASDETVARYAERQRRNETALKETEAVGIIRGKNGEEFEQVMSLYELKEKGISNPSVRFAELMVRVRGMEDHARKVGDICLFITKTAPSRMHARDWGNGQQNELFDGTIPREAQGWISGCWSRIRAALARLGVRYYGVRVAEPHHDGTPHWHMLMFIRPELTPGRSAVSRMMAIIRRYLLRGEWKPTLKKSLIQQGRAQGLTIKAATAAAGQAIRIEVIEKRAAERADKDRREHACDFKRIDWSRGSAAGYIVKYLAKNINGQRMGADLEAVSPEVGPPKPSSALTNRVLAWASCWGIRQFQVLGGPPVGVWRELRRIKEKPEQLELFEAWQATGSKDEERKPDWGRFLEAQGGMEVAREDRPVQLWKLQEPGRRTKYGEEAPSRTIGVTCAGVGTETRNAVWTVRAIEREKKEEGDAKGHSRRMDKRDLDSAVRRVWGLARPQAAQPWTRVNNCTRRVGTGWGRSLVSAYQAGPHVAREVFAALVAAKNAQVGRAFVPVNYQELKNVLQP